MISAAFRYAFDHVPVPAGRHLWIYGEDGVASGEVYQPWWAEAQQLQLHGVRVHSSLEAIGEGYDAVFVHCPKQQEEAAALLALALERSNGVVMAAAANDAGGKRLARMVAEYGIEAQQLAKHQCTIVWTQQAARADAAHLRSQLAGLALRQVEEGEEQWWSQPGLFGWDRVDAGSRLLLAHLPPDMQGRVADFGCGWGYLARHLELRYPGIRAIDAYDADARAVAACSRNTGAKVQVLWQDVTALDVSRRYDAVVMNPPFHRGKAQDVALGAAFIARARQSLRPGGRLFLVANRHLPYEQHVPGLCVLHQEQGYKIMVYTSPAS